MLLFLRKVSIIAIMHEHAYLGKGKDFSLKCSLQECCHYQINNSLSSLPYAIAMTDTEVDPIFLIDVLMLLFIMVMVQASVTFAPHFDDVGSSVLQVIPL